MSTTSELHWYESVVKHGDKSGRTIGFPTINLDPKLIPQDTIQGVYASLVEVDGKKYKGALYFGPRTTHGETHNVLEIFILDFSEEIYDKLVKFTVRNFIRPVIHFTSLEELQTQLKDDIASVRKLDL